VPSSPSIKQELKIFLLVFFFMYSSAMAFFSRGKTFLSNFYALSYFLPILLFVRNEKCVKIQDKMCIPI